MTTDSQKELLTQVDKKNQVVGSIDRKAAHETPGVFYRTVYILVFNEKDEILLQQRSPTKDLYPSCWDLSVGGHVPYSKSYEQTAINEVDEELGLKIREEDLTLKGEVLVKLPRSGEWFNVFEYRLKPGEVITASKEEIANTRWLTIEEIKTSMRKKSISWYPRPLQVIEALY